MKQWARDRSDQVQSFRDFCRLFGAVGSVSEAHRETGEKSPDLERATEAGGDVARGRETIDDWFVVKFRLTF